MTGRLIQGPWQPPPPRVDGQLFEALPDEVQARALRLAFRDLARYRLDLTPNELGWLRAHLPPGPGPVRVSALSRSERVRVAGVVLLLLRRRAGWAA
jgi:hypothetical protein